MHGPVPPPFESLESLESTAAVGYEAARLVASVATSQTVAEWLARASERTVKFLREEVDATKLFARLAPGLNTSPPSDELMQELEALESRVVSGSLFRKLLERLFARCRPPGVSFLRFLCCALIEAWQHTLGSTEKYAQIYARDRYRCLSPVCGRRDLTPHHLKFRSKGGDESSENLASLCVWCHLQGIHGGRLRANPPASDIAWSIGRTGHTEVWGRRRVVAFLCGQNQSPNQTANSCGIDGHGHSTGTPRVSSMQGQGLAG